jgi:hypothetical protein
MEQQTGGFGRWPSDEASQPGVAGAAEAAEPIEAAEAADVVDGARGAGVIGGAGVPVAEAVGDAGDNAGEVLYESTEDPAWDAAEQVDRTWEPGDAGESADAEDLGDAGEPEDDGWVVEDNDAWEVEDSAGGTEPELAVEPPNGPGPDSDPGPRPETGEPRVDAALARLDELAGRPVSEHRPIFEDVHRRLRDVLGELDTREPPEPDNATRSESRAGR